MPLKTGIPVLQGGEDVKKLSRSPARLLEGAAQPNRPGAGGARPLFRGFSEC